MGLSGSIPVDITNTSNMDITKVEISRKHRNILFFDVLLICLRINKTPTKAMIPKIIYPPNILIISKANSEKLRSALSNRHVA